MKKLVILAVAVVLAAMAANAQKEEVAGQETAKQNSLLRAERKALRQLEGKEVSSQSQAAFLSDFGEVADAQWRRSTNFDEATFSKDGKPVTAYYDDDSKLVGTTYRKSFDELPAKAKTYISRKYPGYATVDVILFDDNEASETDMVLYGVQFDDEDNYFIELAKDGHHIIVRSSMTGNVSFFREL